MRRVRFEIPLDLDPVWNPRFPEFSAAANGVSLLMPHVEPYVVSSVRSVLDDLEPELAAVARIFVAQESMHQSQHRAYNCVLTDAYPALGRVERWAAGAYRWLSRTRSTRFSLAFAAGFETVAFGLARWSEAHLDELFRSADSTVSTLFLWHLAEEAEHKSVAFDVYRSVDGSRLRYLVAAAVSLVVMAVFTIAATVSQLWATRRMFSPVAWWRLVRWSLSLAFELLPDLAAGASRGHHPSQLADPLVLRTWLRSFDPETGTIDSWGGARLARSA